MSSPPELEIPRRVFIQRLTFFGGGVVVFGLACKRQPEGTPAPSSATLTTSHRSFTNDEYRVMTAAVDRILPRDQDAGAVEAGVPEYMDRMLQSPELFQMREDFLAGLQHLDRRAHSAHGKSFADLKLEEMDSLLTEFKDAKPSTGEAHFFELLVTLTLEGFLGDPSYGGNKEHVGWELVGFGTSEPPPGFDGMQHLHHMRGGG